MCGVNGISGEAGVGRRGAIGGALANLRPSPRGPAAPTGLASFRPSPRGPAVSTGLESLPASPRRAQNR